MLQVKNITVAYDDVPAVVEVSFHVGEGEIVSIIGANGAGKSTLLRTVSGILRPVAGEIWFEGRRIDRLPANQIVHLGISLVPEGRRIFGRLSVLDNLILGAYTNRDPVARRERLDFVFSLFPVLHERAGQRAGTLSGGEQQMLAIGRALMSRPRLLMLDEPSLGLMPKLTARILQAIQEINRQGVTVLLVEQRVREALEIAHRGYVLQTGRIVATGTGSELLHTDLVRKAYLGL
ncbi:MAG: ABC transporter ATP-binding protein [Armatimonadota bacterium]|nr:ABC transporter ATP-binding protein [Armatimonadota bacterium]MDR5703658.1 ABC transporter ATP-binding protein [Armatimonadota bacterium]MDR7434634.1 ABC transporter ATP-binding protein [Armatimonadota bacterium]